MVYLSESSGIWQELAVQSDYSPNVNTMQHPGTSHENGPLSAPCFETFFQENGKYGFQFLDEAGEAIFFGKTYTSEKSRDTGLKSVIRTAIHPERYETAVSKQGMHYFILKSGNHREIGRSALFATESGMNEKMNLLRSIGTEPIIRSRADRSSSFESGETVNTAAMTQPQGREGNSDRTDKPDLMPRYRFTLIFYPDSGIWMVKNDFTGDGRQLKVWNPQALQIFLKEQFPEGERSLAFPDGDQSPPGSVGPTIPSSLPATQPSREVPLSVQTKSGHTAQQMVASRDLASVEVGELTVGELTSRFGARILARSIDRKKDYLMGMVSGEKLQEGRLVIPILGGERLAPGPYLFLVTVAAEGQTEPAEKLIGRQMLMLN